MVEANGNIGTWMYLNIKVALEVFKSIANSFPVVVSSTFLRHLHHML